MPLTLLMVADQPCALPATPGSSKSGCCLQRARFLSLDSSTFQTTMSLRFDHLMQNAASSASSSNFLAAAASFMSEYMSAAGAFHDHPRGSSTTTPALPGSSASKISAKTWDSKTLSKKAKQRRRREGDKTKTNNNPHSASPAPCLPYLDEPLRIQLYRSYQHKFRQAWHDAKPGDLVALESEVRRELQDAALQPLVHRSIIGECLLDCLSMHYQMTKTYPSGKL